MFLHFFIKHKERKKGERQSFLDPFIFFPFFIPDERYLLLTSGRCFLGSWGSLAFGVWRLLLTLLKANDSDSRSMKDLPCLNCKWIEVRSPPPSLEIKTHSHPFLLFIYNILVIAVTERMLLYGFKEFHLRV